MNKNEFNVTELLSRLRGLGVELGWENDKLRIDAPKGVLSSSLREELSQHKSEILRFLAELEPSMYHEVMPLQAVSRERALPLSFSQERLWFLHQLEPKGTAYSIPGSIRLKGKLDKNALEQAFVELARRHETLRTTFHSVRGLPGLVIAPEPGVSFNYEDLRQLPVDARKTEAIRLADEQSRKPFDLVSGPLLRISLYQLGDEDHVIHFNMHHIISDHWSFDIITREFGVFYRALNTGTLPQLPALPIQYADFAYWQRQWLSGDTLNNHLAYWKDKLGGELTTLDLAPAQPRSGVQTHLGAKESLSLSWELVERLRSLSRREGMTLFMTLLAAFKMLLYRLTGQEDILVGTATAGRDRMELEGLIGFFINTVVMRTDLSGNPTFRELLERVRETALGAYAHQEMPFEKLVEVMSPERDLSRSPLFQILFNHTVVEDFQAEIPGLKVESFGEFESESKFDLTFYVGEKSGEITLTTLYNAGLFSRERMICLLEQYQHLLGQIVVSVEKPIQSYSLVTPGAGQILPNPRMPIVEPPQTLLTDMFSTWVKRAPERPAVAKGDQTLTYEDLFERTQVLARTLRVYGVEPGNVVAVCGQRSFGLIVSMMAVLSSGSVLLTIDDSLPLQRQQLMIREAGARFLLNVRVRGSEKEPMGQDPALDVRFIEVDAEGLAQVPIGFKPGAVSLSELGLNDPAYIFFTSGTTGTPKGILGSHKGLSHFLNWQRETFGITPEDRVAQFTSLSFDPVLREIFLPLTSGATLCLPEAVDVINSNEVLSWLERERISVLHTVPTLAHSWLTTTTSELPLSGIRLVFFAGEPLTENLVQEWWSAFPGSDIINLYGPTETTLAKCFYRVVGEVKHGVQPLGSPLPQTQALVLSRENQLCGIGEPGEIVLRTPFRSLGYVNNKEENRKSFVKNPFRDDEADVVYFTGDRGCYRPDGILEFLGRLDDQVKIRGLRVEPNEIAVTLAMHPTVDSCFVTSRQDEQGRVYLAAYVVVEKQNGVTVSELTTYLKQRLPATMVPEAFVFLDSFPLTPRGKIDRQALPSPDRSRPELEEVFVAPRSQSEELVAGIWSHVLGREQIGVFDNFFELGGHSLLATQVISRVRDTFQLDLPVRAIFESPTISGLVQRIQVNLRDGQQLGPASPSINPITRSGDLPLSYSQERMWFLQQLIPEGTAYNMSNAVLVEGVLDADRVKQTFYLLAKRHESLRTTFQSRDGRPFQRIAMEPDFLFQVVDLGHLPPADRQPEALRLATENSRRPFDLDSGPLLRVNIYRLSEESHILHVSMHHIITDLWSLGILGREFFSVYQQLGLQRPVQLPERRIDYVDFAAWQRNWLTGDVLEGQLAYWREQLAGLQVLGLSTDRPRPPVWSGKGARVQVQLSEGLVADIKAFAAGNAATPFMALLAAFYALLWRYSGQEDIAVGVPIANRHRTEIEEVVGTFVNTLVFRMGLTGDLSFRDLVLKVRHTALSAYAHQDLPFERLVNELHPDRDPSHAPLVQVMFNIANTPAADMSVSGLTFHPLAMDRGGAQFDLTMAISLDSIQPAIIAEYATDLFEQRTAQRMMKHYLALVASAIRNPNQFISEISFLDESEAKVMLEEWNETSKDYPADKTASRLFEGAAGRHPESLAVLCGSDHISYGELNRRANRLARYLLKLGAESGSLVGIFVERSINMVVSLLGVMKSGAAYLPLDPIFPSNRIGFMLKDSRASVVITQSSLLDILPECNARIVSIDGDAEEIEHLGGDNLEGKFDTESLAYVIYTSGSTGLPKGVQICHRGLVNFLRSMADEPGMTADDTILAVTTLSFDIAGLELFLPLIVGGKIALADRDTVADGRLLTDAIKSSGATVLQATPASWRMLIEGGWQGDKRLKALVGGEALSQELAVQLLARCREVWNMYGPTETTIWSTISRVTNIDEPILIGKPIANTTIYVLDKNLRPVPIGVPGELHIGGDGLARGYLNRDTLTQEKFIPNPLGRIPGERVYKTGDLARYRSDGRIECFGRLDHQVKVRGFRIELGEIETALAEHPGVKNNVVVAREDRPGEKRLVAYIVPEKEATISLSEIRANLKRTLPEYMIPSAFVVMDELPLTPNGKINRLALPVPDSIQLTSNQEYLAPHSPLEEMLVAIWKEVLELDDISVHDNFYDIGGHSLLSMQVISRLEEKIGLRISPRELIYQTLGQLATSIERQRRDVVPGDGRSKKDSFWHSIRRKIFLKNRGD